VKRVQPPHLTLKRDSILDVKQSRFFNGPRWVEESDSERELTYPFTSLMLSAALHRTLPVPPFHFFDVTDRTLPVPPFHFFDVTDEVVGVYEVYTVPPSPTISFRRNEMVSQHL
jgi:hypothetical protein